MGLKSPFFKKDHSLIIFPFGPQYVEFILLLTCFITSYTQVVFFFPGVELLMKMLKVFDNSRLLGRAQGWTLHSSESSPFSPVLFEGLHFASRFVPIPFFACCCWFPFLTGFYYFCSYTRYQGRRTFCLHSASFLQKFVLFLFTDTYYRVRKKWSPLLKDKSMMGLRCQSGGWHLTLQGRGAGSIPAWEPGGHTPLSQKTETWNRNSAVPNAIKTLKNKNKIIK